MKRIVSFVSLLVVILVFLSGCYNQKSQIEKKADLQIEKELVNEKVIANYWGINHSSVVPQDMLAFVGTAYDQNAQKHSLYPKNLIYFKGNGDFVFLWDKGNAESGNIKGSWYVKDNVLIFVLGDTYSARYTVDTQLRYFVIRNKSGLVFKDFGKGIESKESHYLPLSGFTKIVISMQDELVQKSIQEYEKIQN